MDDLKAAFGPKTKALVLNNPMNPIGKVFTRDELEAVAGIVETFDTYVVCDEVYEHLVFAPAEHISLITLPGMQHLESIKNTVNLKGFRPGKVPVSHLKRAYGKSMMGDIIQEAVTEVSNLALKERELRPAQQPDINFDEDKLPDVVEGKADLAFKMAVEVMQPKFKAGKGLKEAVN